MEHLEVHTGDKPFLCQQCDNSITTQDSGMKVQVIVDTGAKLVQCEMCGKKFTRASNLTGHIVVHKTEKPYKCDKCQESFETPSALKMHMDCSHSDSRFECEICHKTFSTQGNLCKHKRLHETSKPFPCDVCKKTYATKAYLKSHMWEHVEDKPFECEICKKKFPLLTHLKRHMIVHADVKPHQCDICGKQFPTTGNLKRHKQTHILYECQVCGKRCSKLDVLKEHLTDHLEEKAFGCEICDRRFKTEVLLNAHQWVHTRDKNPYFCSICKMKFSLSKDLKDHKLSVHGISPKPPRQKQNAKGSANVESDIKKVEEEVDDDDYKVPKSQEPEEIRYMPYDPNKRFPCDLCGKTFKTSRIRAQHQRLHEESKCFKCEVCGGTFQTQTNLRRHSKLHTRAHPYQCTVCDKSYKTVGALKTHMWEHNDIKPFECEICHKKFSQEVHVKRHMIIHSTNKKFKCELCDMSFNQSGNYKRHKATHSVKLKSKCPICEQLFRTSAEMMKHLEQHNTSKQFQCRFCQRRYATDSLLKAHMWAHAEKRFYCKKCNKRFASRIFLRRHMTVHAQQEKESAHQCEICKKRFLKLGNYQAHVTHHGLYSKLKCTFCNISFANNRYIDKHMKENHPESAIFKCTFCNEAFLTTYLQMKHVKTKHMEESRALYKCQKCEREFSSQDTLTAHQVDHGDEKPFKCTGCSESFTNKLRLQLHNRIHRGAFNCRYCKLVFKTPQARLDHVKATVDAAHRPFHCKTCKKMFSSKQRLQRHDLIHSGERPFPCTRCEKRFTQAAHLKDHMRLHTGEKPFHCTMCDRKFTHSRTLRCHAEVCFGRRLDCPCGCGRFDKPHKAFQCDVCEKRFRYQKYLKMHVQSGQCVSRSCPCGCKGDIEIHVASPENDEARNLLQRIELGTDESENLEKERQEGVMEDSGEVVSQSETLKPVSVSNVNMENTMKLVETILEAAEEDALRSSVRVTSGRNKGAGGSEIFPCYFCKRIFEDDEARAIHVQNIHETVEPEADIVIKKEPVDDFENAGRTPVEHMDNFCQTDDARLDQKLETNPKYRIVYVAPDGTDSYPGCKARTNKQQESASSSLPEAIEATSSVEQLIEAATMSETVRVSQDQEVVHGEHVQTSFPDGTTYTTLGMLEEQAGEGQVMSIVSAEDYEAGSHIDAVTVLTDGDSDMPETFVLDSIPADAVRIIATRPDNDTDTIIIKIEYDDNA